MEHQPDQYLKWFRNSSPYINAHRQKTFVLALSGEAQAHANFHNIIHDIALLSSLGVRLVLVYGARPQINQRLQQASISSTFVEQKRITNSESLPHVLDAVGTLRIQIEALLSMGLANSPMHGARIRVSSGNFVTAKPIGIINGEDFQHTGEVRRLDVDAIHKSLNQGDIVALPCLGYSPTGEIFNLCYEEVATQTAMQIGADKLVLFISQFGLLDSTNQLIREISPLEISQNNDYASTNSTATISALKAAQKVCQNKDHQNKDHQNQARQNQVHQNQAHQNPVKRAHLVSFQEDGALIKELYTRDGNGTLVSQKRYEQIRQASVEDVGGILELIHPLEEAGVLVRRSRERLETEIEQFTIIERDGMIIACAALYPFDNQLTGKVAGEVACVAVHADYRHGKRGERLLNHLEQKAVQMGFKYLFVLTTRTAHWFLEKGFEAASLDELPESRKTLYNWQRNSKTFKKKLN